MRSQQSPDRRHDRGDDYQPHVSQEPTQLLIDIATPEGRQSGLLFTSAVQCENIVTVDGSFVLRKIGSLPPEAMQQVNICLKASLGIP